MTAILSWIIGGFAFQVADRLVSTVGPDGRPVDIYDPFFNKTVVYLAPDALLSLSFSGTAYVGDTPTDQYIAECLAGLRLDTGVFTLSTGDLPHRHHLEAIADLCRRLTLDQSLIDGRIPPVIDVIGWQQLRRGGVRPILRRIGPARRRGFAIARGRLPRRPASNQGLGSACGSVMRDEVNAIRRDLDAAYLRGPEGFEQALVDGVRTVASRPGSGVGQDCISVRLQPFEDTKVVVGYHTPSTGPKPSAFTPWFVARGAFQAPAEVAGTSGLEEVLGPLTLRVEHSLPQGQSATVIDVRRQTRRRAP